MNLQRGWLRCVGWPQLTRFSGERTPVEFLWFLIGSISKTVKTKCRNTGKQEEEKEAGRWGRREQVSGLGTRRAGLDHKTATHEQWRQSGWWMIVSKDIMIRVEIFILLYINIYLHIHFLRFNFNKRFLNH